MISSMNDEYLAFIFQIVYKFNNQMKTTSKSKFSIYSNS